MYKPTLLVPYRHHGHCGCGCECKCEEYNFYAHPVPRKREVKLLDTVHITIHTDEFVRHECIKGPCCEPEPVKVIDEKKSFIITAETNCVKPGFYYQLDIDRHIPCEVCGLNTYIRLVPCGFFNDKVELTYNKVIHGGHIHGHHEHGEHGFEHGEHGEHVWHGEGPIPNDPSFPAQDFVGWHGHKEDGIAKLIPVKLDLLGNVATGEHFFTGKYKVPGTGRPYSNRFMLYLNNTGEFILTRNFHRRSDFA